MKTAIIIVNFTLLLAPYTHGYFKCHKTKSHKMKQTQEIDQISQKNGFEASESLVFITDKNEFLLSGALVNFGCVLTSSKSLLKFVNRDESDRKLFVGIGKEPYSENVHEYLHPVDDRIHEFHRQCQQNGTLNDLAIVMDKNIKKYPITEVYVEAIARMSTTRIYIENEEVNDYFKGGFIICKTAILGIVIEYRYSKRKNSILLTFKSVILPEEFIRAATFNALGYKDIHEDDASSSRSGPLSPVFSD